MVTVQGFAAHLRARRRSRRRREPPQLGQGWLFWYLTNSSRTAWSRFPGSGAQKLGKMPSNGWLRVNLCLFVQVNKRDGFAPEPYNTTLRFFRQVFERGVDVKP